MAESTGSTETKMKQSDYVKLFKEKNRTMLYGFISAAGHFGSTRNIPVLEQLSYNTESGLEIIFVNHKSDRMKRLIKEKKRLKRFMDKYGGMVAIFVLEAGAFKVEIDLYRLVKLFYNKNKRCVEITFAKPMKKTLKKQGGVSEHQVKCA